MRNRYRTKTVLADSQGHERGPSYEDLLRTNHALREELHQVRQFLLSLADGKAGSPAAQRAGQMYKFFVDMAPIGMARTDAETGVILGANRCFHEMLGYDYGELPGKRFTEITFREDRDENWSHFRNVIENREHRAVFEKRYIRKDGNLVWARVVTTNIFDVERPYVVAIIHDLTEQKATEEALAIKTRQTECLSSMRLKALTAENLQVLFDHVVNETRVALGVDFVKILELDAAGDGKSLLLRSGVGWRPGIVGAARVDTGPQSQAGYTLAVENPVVVKDLNRETRFSGPALLREHGVQSGMSVIIPGQNRPFGVLGAHAKSRRAFTDADVDFLQNVANLLSVSIRHLWAEAELNASEARFRAIFHNAAVVIAITDPNGNWLDFNNQLCELTGYSREELLQSSFQAITHPDDLRADLENLEQLRAGLISSYGMEKRYLRNDGSIVWIHLAVSCERGQDGAPDYFIGIIEDITEQKRAEELLRKKEEALRTLNATLEHRVRDRTEELIRRNEELDQFAYVASHDLRAPLRAIQSLAGWIKEDSWEGLTETSQRHLNLLQGRAQRLETMLNDLLAYSRADKSKGQLRRIDPNQILKEVVETIPHSHDFTITVQTGMPLGKGYPVALELVFRNLLENAIKHHDRQHGIIKVGARDMGDMIEFWVTDDGPGIPPDYQDRVFEMFQTLKPRDVVEGSGIGLALVKKTVENHGGRVEVESSAKRGTTVRFTWPQYEESWDGGQPEGREADSHPARG